MPYIEENGGIQYLKNVCITITINQHADYTNKLHC